ncbi:SurA N-terminal domain-containing protein [Trichloromonas sp.]|uniref:SurA N-terminal domain-containing protein n=1 Tax=Trichloromonas sp. TaxID=3069249 RepID=UPI002A3F915F|nr:SurA N-terminal domain-containing protein [Trichloromonas sp.]
MLDLIRKKQKSVFIKLAFAIIILSFIIGYAMLTSPGDSGDARGNSVAVTIDDASVSFADYESAYGNLYSLYQNIYREQFTPELEKQLGLRRQALDMLVEQALLSREASRLKLKVADQELVKAIADVPAFQEGGAFNKDRYLQVLAYQRLTPEEFESRQRQQLLAEKAREAIIGQVDVGDADIDDEYRRRYEQISLAFVRLAPARFEDRAKPDEEALQAFFAENRERFRLPESVALRYLLFEPSRYAEEVSVSDEDLEKYYRRNLDKFDIPEQVKASHILIKVPLDADPEARKSLRERAEKVLAEVKEGKDFATLVRQYSDDQGSVPKGGSLGFFPRGVMVPEFEAAAFAMKPGEISDIVTTPFGYHIIRCDGYVEPGIKPLDEVRDEAKAAVVIEKSRQLALEKGMDAYNINRKSGDLESAAQANGLEIRETGFFERDGAIEGFGPAPEVSAAAFTLEEKTLARPLVLPQGVILFTLKERRASRIPELSEVRGAVEEDCRRQRSHELARTAAEELLAALQQGASLVDRAAAEGLRVEETGLFSRANGEFLPRLGNAPELAKAAFDLESGKTVAPAVYEVDGTFVVAALKERQTADPTKLDAAGREELRAAVLTRKKDERFKEKMDALKTQANIVVSPAIQASIEKDI